MNNPEAQRCLLCKKPFCSLKGCPVKTDVPAAMALYREGKLGEAGDLLFRNNPFSAVTSLVCDWKKFCYGNCVLGIKGVPVRWYEIEQEISGKYIFEAHPYTLDDALSGKSVAVVGAGPAGITAALLLRAHGASVTVFDANPRVGGVLRYGIPEFRLDRALVDQYERLLGESGAVFKGGVEMGKEITVSGLSKEYEWVIVAAGAEKPVTLGIPGEDSPSVIQALGYLKAPDSCRVGHKVIVIGGGNVAMDACRTATRRGHDTWVFYRKTFVNMPANPLEVEEAKADGVRFKVFQAPVEVGDGYVVFRDCENVTDPETGRLVTRIIPGTDHKVSCDTLITAISEKPCSELVDGAADNVLLAGDFLYGPRTVVEAVVSAKETVQRILGV